MERKFAVIMDQGSSSSRTLLLDNYGKIYCRAQNRISPEYRLGGRAEYDAEKLYQSQIASLKEVLKAIPKEAGTPILGMASQRSTVVLWDSANGMPLCPAMSWQDGRAEKVIGNVPLTNVQTHRLTGLYKTPYYSAPKIAWAIENLSSVREAAEKGTLRAGSVSSYILWRLSGGRIFACDPSLAQRMLLMNLKTGDWDSRLLSAFGVKRQWLPQIMPSSGQFGTVELEGYNMQVLSMLGDQQAAMSGLGIGQSGEGALNYGTGAFLLVYTGGKPLRIPGLLDSYGWKRGNGKPEYFSEALVNSAGSMMEWLRTRMGLFSDIDEANNLCRNSKQRTLCLPVIGGLASPYWDFEVKTCFAGLTAASCKADLVRAAVDGIAFMIADGLEKIKRKGIPVRRLKAGGGLSRMTYLMQFQADISGAEISVMDESEETALGAGREAFNGAGISTDFPEGKSRTFLPRISEETRQRMLLQWRDFVRHCQSGRKITNLTDIP